MAIFGTHFLIYSTNPDADRAFLRDVLELEKSLDVQSERLGHYGKPQFIAIDLGVGMRVVGILESGSVSYVHGVLLK